MTGPLYFPFCFLICWTICAAVRSKLFGADPLRFWYADQITARDFNSTRKIVPLPPSERRTSRRLLAVIVLIALIAVGLGRRIQFVSFCSNDSPNWSVKTASASFGSVTTRNTPLQPVGQVLVKPARHGQQIHRLHFRDAGAKRRNCQQAAQTNSHFISSSYQHV